tara:strand:- start:1019 stop:1318 length:300 start_codon:yes stop_codon:yes gene_type:complete
MNVSYCGSPADAESESEGADAAAGAETDSGAGAGAVAVAIGFRPLKNEGHPSNLLFDLWLETKDRWVGELGKMLNASVATAKRMKSGELRNIVIMYCLS